MAAVRLLSESSVHAPNHSTLDKKIELTPWDLRYLPIEYIQKGLLFSKPKQPPPDKETENTFIRHLSTSLSHALDHFPQLAGRLATTHHEEDDTVSFFIDCNNAGALFIDAAADGVTISDIIKPVYVPPIVHSFFPLNGLYNHNGDTNPLLGVQVTNLADGVFIGCSLNHVVGDGSSFWHFLNSWSEISMGSIKLSKPPVFRRWFPDGSDIPVRIPRSCFDIKQSNEEDIILPPVGERIFHFSKENIAKLKARANAEIGTDNISSLQALLSHIWLSVIRNRSFDPNEETKYFIVVGARQRLKELSNNYFGNAIQGTFVSMKAKELLEQGTGVAAREMNNKIATMTEESFKKLSESWIASPKLVAMSNVRSSTALNLITSSSPRFNMYGNDFGVGKPIAVRSGLGNKVEGKITLFCGAEEGSIDVEAFLFVETLEALANDEEFMEMVTL